MSNFSWQRAVIKVGSALVSPDGHNCSHQYLDAIAKFITQSTKQGKEIILVSSGSVAAARTRIKTGHKPTIAEKQAMAAIGQTKMMANWAALFEQDCAQVLLTVDDLAHRKRFVNIKNTLETLLANGALPIVNENDTVVVDEIKVGDNDNLAAHTAIAAQADCLIICTDVDGLYTSNPRSNPSATLITKVEQIDEHIMSLAGGAGTSVGTGGMVTKLQAALKCTQSGINTILLNGQKSSSFDALTKGEITGTLFTSGSAAKSRARQDWLAHTSKIKGSVHVDAGAHQALTLNGASLLAAGIVNVMGKFNAGDNVEVMHQNKLLAKGLVAYSSTELQRIVGCKSEQISEILGYDAGEAVIHRDNLVLRD
ncbi:glutamate 5-kinase [Glaciecola sp. 2405UD65-10]|uniref:glutamate 5-kinase n=1 Tax=Glaciecola sp. 2405UD65-10 TaxID=3397244 RepID=UPI003B5A3B85